MLYVRIKCYAVGGTDSAVTDVSYLFIIFFCEEPRSRCYGRTEALRLIVQPCDEDEEKDN